MPRRHKIQREKDLVAITDKYIRGELQVNIGKDLGISQQMVSKDLVEIQRRWVEHTTRNLDVAKGEELAKIDKLEREYWGMYENSRSHRTETFIDSNKKKRTVLIPLDAKNPHGNPEYLEGVRKCIVDRRTLLGLDAKKGIDITSGGEILKAYINVSPDDWDNE